MADLLKHYVLDEIERVLTEQLGFSFRLARLTRRRCLRRARRVTPPSSRHEVPGDPADSPVLRAALTAGVDYLVSNDRRILALDPYEGLRIISMSAYYELLIREGLLR